MEQTWTSDQTDPIDRLYIQYGYLSASPRTRWFAGHRAPTRTKRAISIEFAFDVAFQGVLGIGNNISRWSKEQRELAARKIAQYKEIRHLIQNGIVSRLRSPFEGNRVAIQYTSESGDESVVLCYNLAEVVDGATSDALQSRRLKLERPAARRDLSGRGQKLHRKIPDGDLECPGRERFVQECVINLKAVK